MADNLTQAVPQKPNQPVADGVINQQPQDALQKLQLKQFLDRFEVNELADLGQPLDGEWIDYTSQEGGILSDGTLQIPSVSANGDHHLLAMPIQNHFEKQFQYFQDHQPDRLNNLAERLGVSDLRELNQQLQNSSGKTLNLDRMNEAYVTAEGELNLPVNGDTLRFNRQQTDQFLQQYAKPDINSVDDLTDYYKQKNDLTDQKTAEHFTNQRPNQGMAQEAAQNQYLIEHPQFTEDGRQKLPTPAYPFELPDKTWGEMTPLERIHSQPGGNNPDFYDPDHTVDRDVLDQQIKDSKVVFEQYVDQMVDYMENTDENGYSLKPVDPTVNVTNGEHGKDQAKTVLPSNKPNFNFLDQQNDLEQLQKQFDLSLNDLQPNKLHLTPLDLKNTIEHNYHENANLEMVDPSYDFDLKRIGHDLDALASSQYKDVQAGEIKDPVAIAYLQEATKEYSDAAKEMSANDPKGPMVKPYQAMAKAMDQTLQQYEVQYEPHRQYVNPLNRTNMDQRAKSDQAVLNSAIDHNRMEVTNTKLNKSERQTLAQGMAQTVTNQADFAQSNFKAGDVSAAFNENLKHFNADQIKFDQVEITGDRNLYEAADQKDHNVSNLKVPIEVNDQANITEQIGLNTYDHTVSYQSSLDSDQVVVKDQLQGDQYATQFKHADLKAFGNEAAKASDIEAHKTKPLNLNGATDDLEPKGPQL